MDGWAEVLSPRGLEIIEEGSNVVETGLLFKSLCLLDKFSLVNDNAELTSSFLTDNSFLCVGKIEVSMIKGLAANVTGFVNILSPSGGEVEVLITSGLDLCWINFGFASLNLKDVPDVPIPPAVTPSNEDPLSSTEEELVKEASLVELTDRLVNFTEEFKVSIKSLLVLAGTASDCC